MAYEMELYDDSLADQDEDESTRDNVSALLLEEACNEKSQSPNVGERPATNGQHLLKLDLRSAEQLDSPLPLTSSEARAVKEPKEGTVTLANGDKQTTRKIETPQGTQVSVDTVRDGKTVSNVLTNPDGSRTETTYQYQKNGDQSAKSGIDAAIITRKRFDGDNNLLSEATRLPGGHRTETNYKYEDGKLMEKTHTTYPVQLKPGDAKDIKDPRYKELVENYAKLLSKQGDLKPTSETTRYSYDEKGLKESVTVQTVGEKAVGKTVTERMGDGNFKSTSTGGTENSIVITDKQGVVQSKEVRDARTGLVKQEYKREPDGSSSEKVYEIYEGKQRLIARADTTKEGVLTKESFHEGKTTRREIFEKGKNFPATGVEDFEDGKFKKGIYKESDGTTTTKYADGRMTREKGDVVSLYKDDKFEGSFVRPEKTETKLPTESKNDRGRVVNEGPKPILVVYTAADGTMKMALQEKGASAGDTDPDGVVTDERFQPRQDHEGRWVIPAYLPPDAKITKIVGGNTATVKQSEAGVSIDTTGGDVVDSAKQAAGGGETTAGKFNGGRPIQPMMKPGFKQPLNNDEEIRLLNLYQKKEGLMDLLREIKNGR